MRSFASYVVSLVSILMSLLIGSQAQNFDPSSDTGLHQYETYDGARENINLGSGNAFISVPLLTLPGRNGHNYSVSLIANSQAWTWYPGWENNSSGMLVTRVGNISVHPSTTIQPAPSIQCLTGYVMVDENGGTHTFDGVQTDCMWIGGGPNQGMQETGYDVLTAFDDRGEGIHLDLNGCTVTLKDGTWVPLLSGSSGCPLNGVIGNGSYPPVFTDTNGNQITLNVAGTAVAQGPGIVAGGGDTFPNGTDTDTLGRTITFSRTNHTIQYKDSNGTQRTITLGVQPLTFSCTFGAIPSGAKQPSGTVNVITNAVLPNGLAYIFQYDGCGALTKIVYPSGGYTRYVFDYSTYVHATGGPTNGVAITDIELVKKYVCRAAAVSPGATSTGAGNTCPVGEDLTTYTPSVNNTMCNNSADTVLDPLGNETAYQFYIVQAGYCPIGSALAGC